MGSFLSMGVFPLESLGYDGVLRGGRGVSLDASEVVEREGLWDHVRSSDVLPMWSARGGSLSRAVARGLMLA